MSKPNNLLVSESLHNIEYETLSTATRRKIVRKSRKKNHQKLQATSVEYRLKALLRTIKHTCESPKHRSYPWYGGKGIKNFLDLASLVYLYNRDNAELMNRPSIDRINSNRDYRLSNCRFIEGCDNLKRSWGEEQRKTRLLRRRRNSCD